MKDPVQRFMDKVYFEPMSGCWLWGSTLYKNGYGQFWFNGRGVIAHRFIYQQTIGEIADGLTLDHTCRVRSCVNPQHLEPVTNRINVLRGTGVTATNAKKTHCPNGHEYDFANTSVRRSGSGHMSRHCRECHRIWDNEKYRNSSEAREKKRLQNRARYLKENGR